ncbi:hypothetical protein JCM1840_005268 [Sporobolomyces johnsonii]
MADNSILAPSSGSSEPSPSPSTSPNPPSAIRGRPRSTSISSGSPGPAPGMPIPTLFPEPTPPSPQSHPPNPFGFSFPSSSTSTSSPSPLGPPWSRSGSPGSGAQGWGHRPSLSVPGIVAPSPLVPGAAPRGGRHRRTQSVSPPGFPVLSEGAESGFAPGPSSVPRRGSDGSPGSLGLTLPSQPPRLNISAVSIPASLRGGPRSPNSPRSPHSPTRSPRVRAVSAECSPSTSPTNPSPLTTNHHHSHSHHHHHSHASHVSSHVALLQGIRSHALPHSPTLDATPSEHDVPALSTSPSASSAHFVPTRRLSGSHYPTSRPLPSPSVRTSTSSPPFGPTSPSMQHHPSPLALELARPGSPDFSFDDVLRHGALDEAMTDELVEAQLAPLPGPVRRGSGSMSPPLLPLPPELDVHSPTVGGGRRARSTSVSKAVSSSASPASLYLEQYEPLAEGLPGVSGAMTPQHDGQQQQRPASPPLFVDSLFPTSGTLPPPGVPALASRSPPSPEPPKLPSPARSALGFNVPLPLGSAPSPPQSVFARPLAVSPAPVASTFALPLPPSPPPAPPPNLSALSASCPSPSASSAEVPLHAVHSPVAEIQSLDLLPPASPHRSPISLPPPLAAPTPLPPHLVGGPPLRSKSRSRSRERERSRSRSRERDASPGSIKLSGMEFAPKVHSPLASPALGEAGEEEQGATKKWGHAEERESTEAEKSEAQQEKVEQPVKEDQSMADIETTSAPTHEQQPQLAPPVSTTDPGSTTALGLPLGGTSIPRATSPIGIPEHLEDSLPPSSPDSSYFSLAPGQVRALSPPPLLPKSDAPPHERAPSWEDEIDDDEFDELDDDGSGELGLGGGGGGGARRRSSGEKERVSLLVALGITKSPEEVAERAKMEAAAARAAAESERLKALEEEEEEERRQSPRRGGFGALGFMEVDLEAQGENDPYEQQQQQQVEGEAGDLSVGDASGEVLTIDEESLSALERIFVCAKSDSVEERARVAHFLADWLPAVDICEAVEYVLPLLAGLIEDETVKEMFAPQLDRVMWHFFSHCPLAELDPASDKSTSDPGSPVPSRYTAPVPSSTVNPSPTASSFVPSDVSGTPPPTSETSPSASNADSPDIPRISATTFTSLLGALLTDQSSLVAKSTEAALVRFLCKLKDKPLPPESPSEFSAVDFGTPSNHPTPLPELAVSQPSPHHPYDFSTEARRVLEDEVVSGIVIGLARLDEDDREADKSVGGASGSAERGEGSDSATPLANSLEEPKDDLTNPTLFMSPEEDALDDEDKWLNRWHSEQDKPDTDPNPSAGPAMDTWGAPLVSFFDDALDRPAGAADQPTGDSMKDEVPAQEGLPLPSSSPPDQVFSSFSPEGPADEEASIGKMVAMSLIGAIAAADCLDAPVLVEQFLPEVERMKNEAMFYVRKEAVQALGNLARVLPVDVLEATMLPLHTAYSRDQLWHVRRAAVLALPSLCARLPRSVLRSKAIDAIAHFGGDDNRNVRSGALEICGELIYLFYEDPEGVPEELLAFFLGKPSSSAAAAQSALLSDPSQSSPNSLSPLKSALDSPPQSFLDTSVSWTSPNPFGNNLRDADRQILTAFNFPAVVLTLGRDQWHVVREHHLALCQDPVEKARQSLASSLHEVAKIIGPEQADASLLDPLSWFLRDVENIQAAVLDNLPTLFMAFGPRAAKSALAALGDAWPEIRTWRLREHAVKKVMEVGPHFMRNEGVEEVLAVLAKAFKDSVAAVRDQAVTAIPPLLHAALEDPCARNKLLAFLFVFSTDSGYRHRSTYVSTVLASVRADISRDLFEAHFLETLSDLARDKVVSVRIAVARVIGEACRSAALYSDPSTRHRIHDLVSLLAQSPDRDVRLPVFDFYVPSPAQSRPSSPPRTSSPPPDRASGTRSRMDMYEDEPPLSPAAASPLATRPNPFAYGIDIDDDDRIGAEDSFMSDGTFRTGAPATEDVQMFDGDLDASEPEPEPPVLLERPSPALSTSPTHQFGGLSQEVWTRDDGDLVEVSRR